MRSIAVVAIWATLTVPPVLAGESKTVRVYVFGRTQETLDEDTRKAREAETESEYKRAEQGRKELARALEAKHGKRGQDWPAVARDQLDQAWRGEMNALLLHHEVKVKPQELRGAVDGLTNALRGVIKKSTTVALADSAQQADLTVEVLTRRAKTSFPAAAWLLYLKVTPVGWADAGQRFAGTTFGEVKVTGAYLGQILGFQKLRGAVITFHPYSEAEPHWTIEVVQQGTSYGYVMMTAAEALATFSAGLSAPVQQSSGR